MLLFFTLFTLAFAGKRHVPNSVLPSNEIFQSYNLRNWVEYLNLQQCVFVDIGDNYCAMFVEYRSHNNSKSVQEYFIGLCDRTTIGSWQLCPAEVERRRPNDCIFDENVCIAARVHRRLCDVSTLLQVGKHCNCSNTLIDAPLVEVEGFPTCFQPPLPDSLCNSNNVCGLAKCQARPVSGRIYTVLCDSNCLGHQPFCETMDYETTIPSEVISFWSDWSDPICIDSSCDMLLTEAVCINKFTGLGDIDCLGPGTNCCFPNEQYCKCRIITEKSMLRIIKTYQAQSTYWKKLSKLSCIPTSVLPQSGIDYVAAARRKVGLEGSHADEDYIEDDDEDDDMGEEDIMVEEDVDAEERAGIAPINTTEAVEKDERTFGSDSGNETEYDLRLEDAAAAAAAREKNCEAKSMFCAILVALVCFR